MNPILYYMLAATGLVCFIIICWTCNKLVYKRLTRRRSDRKTDSVSLRNDTNPTHDSSVHHRVGRQDLPIVYETRNHLYDSIGEVSLSDPSNNVHKNSLNISDEKETESETCSVRASNRSIKNSSSSTDGSLCDNNSYLNPYETLKKNGHVIVHEYAVPTKCISDCFPEQNQLVVKTSENKQMMYASGTDATYFVALDVADDVLQTSTTDTCNTSE